MQQQDWFAGALTPSEASLKPLLTEDRFQRTSRGGYKEFRILRDLGMLDRARCRWY